MKKIPIYYKILIGLVLGITWSLLAQRFGFTEFTNDWIKPFGTIFINALKLIAVPLVLVSLIDGISNLTDITKLSRIGGKTIGLYLASTVLAITVGLLAVNLVDPGHYVSKEKSEELKTAYAADVDQYLGEASKQQDQGPLQKLVDIVPDNIFLSFTDNK